MNEDVCPISRIVVFPLLCYLDLFKVIVYGLYHGKSPSNYTIWVICITVPNNLKHLSKSKMLVYKAIWVFPKIVVPENGW